MTLADTLAARGQTDGPRIEKVEAEGRTFWIKRPESLSSRMRLQKGDPRAAFARERAAHERFAANGLPVPRIVASGEGFVVTEDVGVPIRGMARRSPADPAFLDALTRAAKALAAFHAAAETHGRPGLKDICLRGGDITFLDFERAGKGDAALDLLVFLFSVAVETGGDLPALTVARDAYVAAAAPDTWETARRRARLFAPLGHLLWPVRRLLHGNREFDGVGPFLRFMAT